MRNICKSNDFTEWHIDIFYGYKYEMIPILSLNCYKKCEWINEIKRWKKN